MAEPEPGSNPGRATPSRLVAHAVVVLTLVVAFLVSGAVLTGADRGPTAAVGLLLPGVPLLLLGLPWSLFFCADPYAFDDAGTVTIHLVIIGPAVVNVLLHGGYRHVRARCPGG